MERIIQLAKQHLDGEITAKAFRSMTVAQLSMLDDDDTRTLAEILADEPKSF